MKKLYSLMVFVWMACEPSHAAIEKQLIKSIEKKFIDNKDPDKVQQNKDYVFNNIFKTTFGRNANPLKNIEEYAMNVTHANANSYVYDGWLGIVGLNVLDQNSRMALILLLENIKLLSQLKADLDVIEENEYKKSRKEGYGIMLHPVEKKKREFIKSQYKQIEKIAELLRASERRNGYLVWEIVDISDEPHVRGEWSNNARHILIHSPSKNFFDVFGVILFETCNSINAPLNHKNVIGGNLVALAVRNEVLEFGSAQCFNDRVENFNKIDFNFIEDKLFSKDNLYKIVNVEGNIRSALKYWRSVFSKNSYNPYVYDQTLQNLWDSGHTYTYLKGFRKYPPALKKKLKNRLEDEWNEMIEDQNIAASESRQASRMMLENLENPDTPYQSELNNALAEIKRYSYQPTHRKQDHSNVKRNVQIDTRIAPELRVFQKRVAEIDERAERSKRNEILVAVLKRLENIQLFIQLLSKNPTPQQKKYFKTMFEPFELQKLIEKNDDSIITQCDEEAKDAPVSHQNRQRLVDALNKTINALSNSLGNKDVLENIYEYLSKFGGRKYSMEEVENFQKNTLSLMNFARALINRNVFLASVKLMTLVDTFLKSAVPALLQDSERGEIDQNVLEKIHEAFDNTLLARDGILADERADTKKSVVQKLIEKNIPAQLYTISDSEMKILEKNMKDVRERIDYILAHPDLQYLVRVLYGHTSHMTHRFDEKSKKAQNLVEKKNEVLEKVNEFKEKESEISQEKQDSLPKKALKWVSRKIFGWPKNIDTLKEERNQIEQEIGEAMAEHRKAQKDLKYSEKKGAPKVFASFENHASFMSFFLKILKENLSTETVENLEKLMNDLENVERFFKIPFYSILRIYFFLAYDVDIVSPSIMGFSLKGPSKNFYRVMDVLEKELRNLSLEDIKNVFASRDFSTVQVSVLEEQDVARQMTNIGNLSIPTVVSFLDQEIKHHEQDMSMGMGN